MQRETRVVMCSMSDLVSLGVLRSHSVRAFPAPSHVDRVELSDPAGHCVAGWNPQAFCHTLADDPTVEHRNAAFLPGQEPLAYRVTDDFLHRLRQTVTTPASGRSTGNQIRDQTGPLPVAIKKNINLTAGDTQRHGGLIGGNDPD